MAQKLLIPINKTSITAAYLNANYKKQFGLTHYGTDIGGSYNIYASGIGSVAFCGKDNVFGNCVGVIYKNAYIPALGKVTDVTFRYYHLKNISVSKGQNVTKDTKLGVSGNTGKYTTGNHLHFEVDTDIKLPHYAPGLAASSNIIKKGNANTLLNPMKCVFCKTSAPENQTCVNSSYNTANSGEAAAVPRTADIVWNPAPPKPSKVGIPVVRNENVDQLQVKVDNLRVRSSASTTGVILGYVNLGIYNVIGATVSANGYTWYQIEVGKWVAYNKDWITLLPKKADPQQAEIERLNKIIVEKDSIIAIKNTTILNLQKIIDDAIRDLSKRVV